MIDFDAMVSEGVISQETRDKIMAYMAEHRPQGNAPDLTGGENAGDAPELPEGEAPEEAPQLADGEAPEAHGDLLADLLSAGVITQEEYDALSAAQSAAAE